MHNGAGNFWMGGYVIIPFVGVLLGAALVIFAVVTIMRLLAKRKLS